MARCRARRDFTPLFDVNSTWQAGDSGVPAAIAVRAEQRSARPAPASRLRLRRIGKRWYAVLRVHARCRVGGTLRPRGRIVRRVAPRRLAPGRRKLALGVLERPGRYALRLRVQRGAAGVQLTAGMRLR
jgi:hypothetical protein